MARIRTIKPEFWTSETIARLSRDARLTFIGMWNESDDYGVVTGNPKILKGHIWLLDEDITAVDVSLHIQQMVDVGLVVRFEAEGKPWLDILGFAEHQQINKRSQKRNPERPTGEKTQVSTPLRESSRSTPVVLTEGSSQEGEGEREREEVFSSAVADEEPKPSQAELDAANPDAIRLADMLAAFLADEFGPSKDYQPARWVPDLAKLLRIDGETPENVEKCLRWIFKSTSVEGAFWRPNIRSGAKLRAQFGQLRDKRKAEHDRLAGNCAAPSPPIGGLSWAESASSARAISPELLEAQLKE